MRTPEAAFGLLSAKQQKTRRGFPRRALLIDHREERNSFLADLAATYSSKP
jgi:hypothetical protein